MLTNERDETAHVHGVNNSKVLRVSQLLPITCWKRFSTVWGA
jgi:hypothetical protein